MITANILVKNKKIPVNIIKIIINSNLWPKPSSYFL